MNYEIDRIPSLEVMEYNFYDSLRLAVAINRAKGEAQFFQSVTHRKGIDREDVGWEESEQGIDRGGEQSRGVEGGIAKKERRLFPERRWRARGRRPKIWRIFFAEEKREGESKNTKEKEDIVS